jgi:hypothetical protein
MKQGKKLKEEDGEYNNNNFVILFRNAYVKFTYY